MIELNKKYSTKELCKALDVNPGTFKKQRKRYLESFSIAYEYHIEYSTTTYYTFTKQLCEYIKPQRKNKREETNKVIREFIVKTIQKDPKQTAANINRIAWRSMEDESITLLGLKESTTGVYIRINLKEMYGKKEYEGGTHGMIERKVWCRLDKINNCYIEMEQELVDEFFDCFDKADKKQKKIDMCIANDYQIGLITREEYQEALGENTMNKFLEGRKLFAEKHGFYPIRVPVYITKEQLDIIENNKKEGIV